MTIDAAFESRGGGDEPVAVHRVRQAQQRLRQLDDQPIVAHIEAYDAVHAVLQDALAELDEA